MTVPPPGRDEITVAVIAAGINPIDLLRIAGGGGDGDLPLVVGFEIAGRVVALGTAADHHAPRLGEEVVAFRVAGGYATALNVPVRDVFSWPPSLRPEQAANLLLAGTAAAELVEVARVGSGDTVLVHGAAGAVGVSTVQQSLLRGARVIGTASSDQFDTVRRFGAEPVAYGPGLVERVRDVWRAGVDIALDSSGADYAIAASLDLVTDRRRIATSAAFGPAARFGFHAVGTGAWSTTYRNAVRGDLVALAGRGELVVPVARTYPFDAAVEALTAVRDGRFGHGEHTGKAALVVPQTLPRPSDGVPT